MNIEQKIKSLQLAYVGELEEIANRIKKYLKAIESIKANTGNHHQCFNQ